MKKQVTLRQKVETLVNDPTMSAYRIANESGLWENSIQRLKTGESKVGNIRLEVAEKIGDFYDRLEAEKNGNGNKEKVKQ